MNPALMTVHIKEDEEAFSKQGIERNLKRVPARGKIKTGRDRHTSENERSCGSAEDGLAYGNP